MAKDVRVILVEDIEELGRAGDIVTVSEGFARNSLFPQGRAALASDREIAAIDARHKKQSQEIEAELAKLHEQAEQLAGTELTLTAKIKDGNEIFGSITAAAIVKELNKQADIKVKPKDLNLDTPITKLGSYDIALDLDRDVETTIRVTVIADPDSQAQKEEDE